METRENIQNIRQDVQSEETEPTGSDRRGFLRRLAAVGAGSTALAVLVGTAGTKRAEAASLTGIDHFGISIYTWDASLPDATHFAAAGTADIPVRYPIPATGNLAGKNLTEVWYTLEKSEVGLAAVAAFSLIRLTLLGSGFLLEVAPAPGAAPAVLDLRVFATYA